MTADKAAADIGAANRAAANTEPAATADVTFLVNGKAVAIEGDPMRRLSAVLRDDLGLTGTKVGCEAGDCGACTVRLDGHPVCACLVPLAQVEGGRIETVEGLSDDGLGELQASFIDHGAVQCGICIPGMLMAAGALPASDRTEDDIKTALGGVLCRCTGYRNIIDAVAGTETESPPVADGEGTIPDGQPAAADASLAVGQRIGRLDGPERVDGSAIYGADEAPNDALSLRIIRSPHASARFIIGDLSPVLAADDGLERFLRAEDLPGPNRFGIYPVGKDQRVLADGLVRHRGEPILAVIGTATSVAGLDADTLPITWDVLTPLLDTVSALAADAPRLHDELVDNVLVRGRVVRGDVDTALASAAAVATGTFETASVEHAYIEPEAGYARRVGDRIEIFASTQTPYMDRDEIAHVLAIEPEQVRIIPSATGGGFGGKLDVSIQPLIAIAAWLLDRPIRCEYTRPESMVATTKRHPARMVASLAADEHGRLTAVRFHGDFDTGAYASWGPTVANRVPVHASGPYEVAAVEATTRAIHTNGPVGGAFRGFGVPQAAIATEALMDELAEQLSLDPLEFRLRNSLKAGSSTSTGQLLPASTGLGACLEALRPAWQELRADAATQPPGPMRRGVGLAAMWYGIGNTSLANPSTIRIGIRRSGRFVMYDGAVDIGQGATTVLTQIAADALGVAVDGIDLIVGDTDRTPDAGKTSASRQTYVSGNAARFAGEELRARLLRLAEVGKAATLEVTDKGLSVTDGAESFVLELATRAADADDCVLVAEGSFDPTTTPLDTDGQGVPYETYAFGAQIAVVDVDIELGQTFVRRIIAAHDVGRAINPTLVEGQIHGGVAQGLGLALMEEYAAGVTDNLHDYLIPTIGDIPPIDCILIEDPEPSGPYGAKGVGEPALIPTAPAVLAAIRSATGVGMRRVPVTPSRLLAAIRERGTA